MGSSDAELEALGEVAFEDAVDAVPTSDATASPNQFDSTPEYTRSSAVRRSVKARADEVCEGCGEPAPFTSKTGRPYPHAHHILSDGRPDRLDMVVALCPNCHYRVHHGDDGETFNDEPRVRVKELETTFETT